MDEAAALVRAAVATFRYWRHMGTGPELRRRPVSPATAERRWSPGCMNRRSTTASELLDAVRASMETGHVVDRNVDKALALDTTRQAAYQRFGQTRS